MQSRQRIKTKDRHKKAVTLASGKKNTYVDSQRRRNHEAIGTGLLFCEDREAEETQIRSQTHSVPPDATHEAGAVRQE